MHVAKLENVYTIQSSDRSATLSLSLFGDKIEHVSTPRVELGYQRSIELTVWSAFLIYTYKLVQMRS